MLVDLGARQLGALHVGARDAGRVDVALDRVVQRPDEVLRVEQREEVGRLLRRDELEVHPEVAAARDWAIRRKSIRTSVSASIRPPGRWIEQSWPETRSISS